MNTISQLLREFTKTDKASNDFVDIITFVEATWGLNTKLWPAQKWLLKMYYGVPLDKVKKPVDIEGKIYQGIPVFDQFMVDLKYEFSEVEFLRYLFEEGRCNVKEQKPFTELLLAIGRRGSKSAMTSMICSYEVYKLLSRYSPHEFYRMLDVGMISISTVATSSKQAQGMYKVIRGYISRCRFFDPFIVSDTEEAMTFRTQADLDKYGPKCKGTIELLFKPAIGRGLRGPANIMCVFDEFAHFVNEGQSSADACYEAATPSTATFKHPDSKDLEGKVACISSPLNKSGLFYQLYKHGMEGKAENRLCIQAPSWEINPTIASKYLRTKYNEDPANFLVEFGAEFSDRFHGWINREEDLLRCIDLDLKPKKVSFKRVPHFIGIDIGLVHNGTAISITHLEDGVIVLDYIEARYAGVGPYKDIDQLDFESIADWIADLCKKFYIWKGTFDQREGLPLEQALRKRGIKNISMEYSSRDSNSKMYQAFKLLILDRKVKLFDCPIPEGEDHCEYIKELLELQEQRLSKYQIEVGAPGVKGKFDDMSDSLARSIWVAQLHLGDQKHAKITSVLGQESGIRKPSYSGYKAYQLRKARSNRYMRERKFI